VNSGSSTTARVWNSVRKSRASAWLLEIQDPPYLLISFEGNRVNSGSSTMAGGIGTGESRGHELRILLISWCRFEGIAVCGEGVLKDDLAHFDSALEVDRHVVHDGRLA
jgi:hypothetical protein